MVAGGLLVKETPSRKNAGAHYTPKSLAEDVVLHALQPLCYSPGPHQTADEASWQLKTSDEMLGLKVADIACGSGAFLVAAARYMADRIVEAWISEEPANAHRKDLHLRAIRKVVANCLLRSGHQRHGRRDVQAFALARLPRPRPAFLLR